MSYFPTTCGCGQRVVVGVRSGQSGLTVSSMRRQPQDPSTTRPGRVTNCRKMDISAPGWSVGGVKLRGISELLWFGRSKQTAAVVRKRVMRPSGRRNRSDTYSTVVERRETQWLVVNKISTLDRLFHCISLVLLSSINQSISDNFYRGLSNKQLLQGPQNEGHAKTVKGSDRGWKDGICAVFNRCLNVNSDGKSFHIRAPATGKARERRDDQQYEV